MYISKSVKELVGKSVRKSLSKMDGHAILYSILAYPSLLYTFLYTLSLPPSPPFFFSLSFSVYLSLVCWLK